MKISASKIRQIVRDELLAEALLLEAAKGIDDFKHGESIVIEREGDGYLIELRSSDDVHLGHIHIAEHDDDLGNCFGAWMIESSKVSDEASGFGPLLYDIAIELAGEAGLMADRWQVSADALAVWEFYLKRRQSEFEFRQLDMAADTLTTHRGRGITPDEQLTPSDPSDDCDSDAAMNWSIQKGVRWDTLPLNYVARRRGGGTPTLDRLKQLNLIRFES